MYTHLSLPPLLPSLLCSLPSSLLSSPKISTGKELHLGPDGFTTAQQQALVEDLQQRTTFEVVEWYRKATDPQPDKRLDAAALLVKADELL